ncbi:MAG: efflux RND transporter periplasmic adaptor subunit [Phycisphaerales bacterium]|nr:efflux RND transporter periplasmic adaptor subunit [Phycisphaerales bacterium]
MFQATLVIARMRFFIGLALVLGLAGGGYFVWSKAPRQDRDKAASGPKTAVVEARNIQFSINSAGDIGPADQVSVRPEVNGRIDKLPVDIGDKVKKGDLLCSLDDKDLRIERSQRQAEIDGAKVQLVRAQRNYNRTRELFEDELISKEVFEDTRTEFELASNTLARANSALELLEDRLSKTRILAPFDCTVLTRPVSIGQAVSGSAGFNSGTEIMSIANLNDMIIIAHVNQTDVIRLAPGQDVDVQVESVPGLKLRGRVERIAPQAILKNGIKGFTARVQIKDIDPRIRPGMTAILTIPVASAENVLSVPLAAVHSDKGDRFVYVKEGDEFVPRPVVIGIADYSNAEVQEGLAEGDIVALEQVANDAIAKVRQTSQPNRLTTVGGGSPPPASGSAAPAARPAAPRQGAERTPSRAAGS